MAPRDYQVLVYNLFRITPLHIIVTAMGLYLKVYSHAYALLHICTSKHHATIASQCYG